MIRQFLKLLCVCRVLVCPLSYGHFVAIKQYFKYNIMPPLLLKICLNFTMPTSFSVFMLCEQELSPRRLKSLSRNVTHANIAPALLQDYINRRKQSLFTEVCNANYESTFYANLNYIREYNLSAALPYMEKFNLTTRPLPSIDQSNITVPVFVTACSSNHFRENLGLLENIERVVRPVFKDLKIVLFDLGLNAAQIEQVIHK